MPDTFFPARDVAAMIGVKIGTLAKWRYLGKGPKGWLRVSDTLVVYPLAGIESWKAERAAAEPPTGFRLSPISSASLTKNG